MKNCILGLFVGQGRQTCYGSWWGSMKPVALPLLVVLMCSVHICSHINNSRVTCCILAFLCVRRYSATVIFVPANHCFCMLLTLQKTQSSIEGFCNLLILLSPPPLAPPLRPPPPPGCPGLVLQKNQSSTEPKSTLVCRAQKNACWACVCCIAF